MMFLFRIVARNLEVETLQVQRVVEGSCGFDGGQVLATAQVLFSFWLALLVNVDTRAGGANIDTRQVSMCSLLGR